MFRIGQGFDLHKLVIGTDLILGGVNIPFEMGLHGHSDADVLLHAIIDALIGAMALGDIGVLYPDNSSKYKNIDSRILLNNTMALLHEKGLQKVVNCDTTIIMDKPKLRKYIDQMRVNIAHDLGIGVQYVSVKAKTSEGVGVVGRGEAVIAQAVVLVEC